MTVDTRTGTGRVVAPVLVGRDDQLRRLTSAVVGPPAVVVVEGEAGIGKTRLVAELAAHPDLAGRPVLTGSCRRIREPFPLGPVVEALRGVGDRLTGELSPVTGSLRGLLPELAGVLPPSPEPLEDRAAQRHRVLRGLTEVLRALGEVVLVLEDLHWADEQTLVFLSYLLAAPPPGTAVVLTYRGEETGAEVREVTARVADAVRHDHLVLPLLDAAQTGVLAATILDTEDLTAEFEAHLFERSSGLPLAVQELLALLRDRGSLIPLRGGGWARRALAELDVPPGVRDPVRERVGRLPAVARTVAEATAVLAAPVPVAVLAEVSGLAREDAVVGLDELLVAGLLSETDGQVGFRHLLAAQAVYGGIPFGRRQELHARAVVAVRALDPVPLGQEAHHLRQAGLLTEWAAVAERVADRASELGDDAEAARILEDVLRTAPLPPDRRATLAVRLGWAAGQVLRPPDVTDLLSDALAAEPSGLARGQLHFLVGLMWERLGRHDTTAQRRSFVAAVTDLGEAPQLAAWAMASLGRAVDPEVPLAEHAAWLDRALAVVPAIGDPVAEVFVLGKIAMSLCAYGDPRWAGLTDTIVARTAGRPRHRQEVHAYRSIAEEACVAGHLAVTDRLLAAALAAAGEDDPSPEPLHRCRLVALLPSWCAGRWSDLDREAAALLDEYRGRPSDRVTPELVAACLALAAGEVDTARRDLPQVVRRAETLGLHDLLPLPVTALLRLASAHGDPAEALTDTAGVVAVWETKGLWPLAVRALPALTEAMVLAGRRAAAVDLVAGVGSALDGLDAPLAAAALPHARGHLGTDPAGAATDFLAAASAYDRLAAPYEAAQARELAAARLVTVDAARAVAPLRAAIDAFARLGARWDLDRAAQLARGNGVTVAGRHRGGPHGYGAALSPREREVAELAASGLTNQRIGRELFLSPRTVEKHLGAALRKLGLRSRVELGTRLTPDP
ncbi:helix-turn-helix transcriptional regulator [Actinophytocola xinjiangensis]|uniref:Helix-turn-helix transcriptional regulator n=1 Tax=Actinophytocola xinjiangensis TaxID=485602 RepID=A0A7Z0WEN8_9PSEU|nr:LuxR family transcriptional regulator [Actinophytocola xinjiangensis]OLF05168.1 helix-turn-helix transcriptional regulator [Actinophytocola xinjiangensis]